MARAKHGDGPGACLQKEREKRAKRLVKYVWPRLDFEKISKTGQLWPRGSLKKRKVRAIFKDWIFRTSGHRYFTKNVCRRTCEILVEQLQYYPTRPPRQSYNQWIQEQCQRFHELCRNAKKRYCRDVMGSAYLTCMVPCLDQVQEKLDLGKASEAILRM